jgi:two-component system sensor histidine kinase CiaH
MNSINRKQLRIAILVYWVLLLYIIAALIWWFIALERQNSQMHEFKVQQMSPEDPNYTARLEYFTKEKDRKTAQYVGEGTTFLLLIILGASFVFRAVRRQLRLQLQEKNFMMAVTHELKTPIAVAKLNLETLQKYELDPEKRHFLIRAALQETQRLETLASNILLSSRLEAKGSQVVLYPLDLSALVLKAAGELQNQNRERKWQIDITPGLNISGDGFLLQMLINNLADNALKYSPADAEISILLHSSGSQVILTVADHGPGIPFEKRSKIFEKFYRIGNEETRTAKGTGLGLYLCKKIAADHRAQIWVKENEPAGSIFTVSFPALADTGNQKIAAP